MAQDEHKYTERDLLVKISETVTKNGYLLMALLASTLGIQGYSVQRNEGGEVRITEVSSSGEALGVIAIGLTISSLLFAILVGLRMQDRSFRNLIPVWILGIFALAVSVPIQFGLDGTLGTMLGILRIGIAVALFHWAWSVPITNLKTTGIA